MYILSKYIIRQHIGPFFFGFFVIILIFILNLVFSELGKILNKGLDFVVIFEFFALNLAWIFTLAIPMSVLMSCLMAFGRISADNEITALKSNGISLYRIVFPVLILATGITFLLIWYEYNVLPDANHRLKLLSRDITIKRPTLNLEAGYLFEDIPNISIKVDHLIENEGVSLVRNVFIHDFADPSLNRSIIAKNGRIIVDEKTGLLHIILNTVELHELNINLLGQYTRSEFQEYIMNIPVPDMVLQRRNSERRGDRELSVQMLNHEIKINDNLIQNKKNELLKFINMQINRNFLFEIDSPYFGEIINFVSLTNNSQNESLHYLTHLENQIQINKKILTRILSYSNDIRNYKIAKNKLQVEIYKKFSIPFACLIFVLIGAPLGIMTNRGNLAVSGGISLVFFIIYWIFLIGGEELADRDILSPAIAMWLANFFVGSFGVYLIICTVREVSFTNPFNISNFLRTKNYNNLKEKEYVVDIKREDYRAISKVITNLATKFKASIIALTDSDGYLITQRTKTTEINVSDLSRIIAGSYAAKKEFSKILGEKHNFKFFYHEGVKKHIYVMNIIDKFLLIIIFNSKTNVGMIRYYTKQAIIEFTNILTRII
ncbi:LptF/LptG family permease [candidate division KSB1 bacterium]|nr:LptF/LptG family permease [candidate division KSB1 bacterium]MBL7093657.1 LptF/LptG family permease [candidate division KSB1 bacterium]